MRRYREKIRSDPHKLSEIRAKDKKRKKESRKNESPRQKRERLRNERKRRRTLRKEKKQAEGTNLEKRKRLLVPYRKMTRKMKKEYEAEKKSKYRAKLSGQKRRWTRSKDLERKKQEEERANMKVKLSFKRKRPDDDETPTSLADSSRMTMYRKKQKIAQALPENRDERVDFLLKTLSPKTKQKLSERANEKSTVHKNLENIIGSCVVNELNKTAKKRNIKIRAAKSLILRAIMSTTGMPKRRTAFGKVLKTTSRHLKQVDQDKAGRKPLPRKD